MNAPLPPSEADPAEAAALADRHHEQMRWSDEEPLRRELVATLEPEPTAALADALKALAMCLRRQGNYVDAVPVLRRLVEVIETVENPTHPSLGLVLDQLAAAISRAHPERTKEVKQLEVRAAHIRARRR